MPSDEAHNPASLQYVKTKITATYLQLQTNFIYCAQTYKNM